MNSDTRDERMPEEIRAVFVQGSRIEDGMPWTHGPNGEELPEGAFLAWVDQGEPCSGCLGKRAEAMTILERELILSAGRDGAEDFIEGEREKRRAELRELGDLCPDCAKKGPTDG